MNVSCDSLTVLLCTDVKSDSSSILRQFKWNWSHHWSNSAGEWVHPTCSNMFMLPGGCVKGLGAGSGSSATPRILGHSISNSVSQPPCCLCSHKLSVQRSSRLSGSGVMRTFGDNPAVRPASPSDSAHEVKENSSFFKNIPTFLAIFLLRSWRKVFDGKCQYL